MSNIKEKKGKVTVNFMEVIKRAYMKEMKEYWTPSGEKPTMK